MASNRSQKKNIPFQLVLTALLDESTVFPPIYLHHFSDLEGSDLQALRSTWPQVAANRRFTLLEDLEELAEADTLVAFDNIARMALDDPDPRVRTVALRLLWETDNTRLVPVFQRMLAEDTSTEVRAAAATALGPFVYKGEVEEIPEDLFHSIEDQLLSVVNSSDDPLVRRRALESLGFSGRKEVPPLLRNAYNAGETEWLVSALFAMGRSADAAWAPEVMRMLRSPKAQVQFEAVRAAGELAIESSRRILLDLLEEEAQDSEIRQAVIWSLSQIGGEEVRETLETILEETEDEEEIELLENALDNLSFTEDVGLYGMFDADSMGMHNEDVQNYLSEQDEEEYQQRKESAENEEDNESPGLSRGTGPSNPSESGKKRPRHHKSQ